MDAAATEIAAAPTAAEAVEPSDEEFLAAFERGEKPGGQFGHRGHLRMTWLYLRRDPARARERIHAGLRRFAAARGVPEKFDAALTDRWIARVAAALARSPEPDFSRFLDENAALLAP